MSGKTPKTPKVRLNERRKREDASGADRFSFRLFKFCSSALFTAKRQAVSFAVGFHQVGKREKLQLA